MKVRELKQLLQEANDEDDVLVSTDDEGNGYREARGIDLESNWDGEWNASIGYRELTKELEDQGYTDEDTLSDGKPCIIIY